MGKGLALAFKKEYPDNFEFYKKACEEKSFDTGQVLIFPTGKLMPRYIINFPTKKHWKYPSKMEYIESGLDILAEKIKELNIKSISIPPLGSGNGKLDWNSVKKMIVEKLQSLKDCEIIIYEPGFLQEIKTVGQQPTLTLARAMLLYLFYKYKALDYDITMLVSQKLAYFLQRFGEPLRLRYEKGWYGPFAPNLNKVLEILNGYYIYYKKNDDSPSNVIRLEMIRQKDVEDYLHKNISFEQKQRLNSVCSLIEGFETPFSLELLATVDFILKDNPDFTPIEIHENIQNWTQRKKELMKPLHIEVAFNKLNEFRDLLIS
ncbi:MAG: macro domain-containing protein [Bacteroidales bacterium]|nr:macro domain-containing protein [Bacteroidales bacterium]